MAKRLVLNKASKPMQYTFLVVMLGLFALIVAFGWQQWRAANVKVTDQYKHYKVAP